MVEHHASVVVAQPVESVFDDFARFENYPQLMTDVREITLLGDETSRWVVDVMGRHEWVARNENWILNRQIGWASTSGLQSRGLIRLEPLGERRTRVDVRFWYDPPGALGELGEKLGVGHSFEQRLQRDLDRYAASFQEPHNDPSADGSFIGSVALDAIDAGGVTGTAAPAEDNTAPAIFEVMRSTVPGTIAPGLVEGSGDE